MNLDRILSILAFAGFAAFLLILGVSVPSFDLALVLITATLFCGYDFFIHRPPGKPK